MSMVDNENELINQLQSTNEYKRSCAIAESIQLLLNKISELEAEKSNLIKINDDAVQSNANQSALITKLKSENALLQNESKLYKTKLSVTEQLNKTLEQTVNELNSKISTQQKTFNTKCEQFSNVLNEYKNIFEELKIEKLSLETQLSKSVKELTEAKSKNEILSKQIDSLKQDQQNSQSLNKKLKEYELLLYKIDLENQTFKQEIKNLHNKYNIPLTNSETIDNSSGIPVIKKIDLNSELNTIENDYKSNVVGTAVNLCTETDTNGNNDKMFIGDSSNYNDYEENNVDLATITKEIKDTEKTLKEYSTLLLQKEGNNNQASSQEFKDIMKVMENQTEKLINLKKQYNKIITSSI